MARILKEDAERRLADVPDEHAFWCCDGSVFRSLQELQGGLAGMSDETYAFHARSDHNDFSNWVRDVIHDQKLARDLLRTQSRTRASDCVAARVEFLAGKK